MSVYLSVALRFLVYIWMCIWLRINSVIFLRLFTSHYTAVVNFDYIQKLRKTIVAFVFLVIF